MKLVLEIRGGILQAVFVDHFDTDVEVVLCDWDNIAYEDDDLLEAGVEVKMGIVRRGYTEAKINDITITRIEPL